MGFADVRESFAFAWGRLKANPVFYILGFWLLMFVLFAAYVAIALPALLAISLFSAGFGLPHAFSKIAGSMVGWAFYALAFAPLWLGFYKGLKRDAEEGPAGFLAIFSGFKDYFSVAGFALLFGAISLALTFAFQAMDSYGHGFLGSVFFLVASILIAPVGICGFIAIANGEKANLGAMAFLRGLKEWNLFLVFWAALAMALGLALGLLCCCVGVLVTAPLSVAVVWRLCSRSMARNAPQSQEPDIFPDLN